MSSTGINSDQQFKVVFRKKHMAARFFDDQLGPEYLNGEGLESVSYQDLLNQRGEGSLWGYYDTGFSLVGEDLFNEAVFDAFLEKMKEQRHTVVRFYAKRAE